MKRELIVCLTCSLVAGCSSLRYEDDDGDPAPVTPPGAPDCFTDPDSIIELSDVESATLFGDVLHVEGRVAGEPAYAVLSLNGADAELETLRSDLAGGASWTLATPGHYVRLSGSRLDVLEATSAVDASIASSTELGATSAAGFAGIGAVDDAIVLCLQSPGDDAPILSRIDLSDPAAPGAVTPFPPPAEWNQSTFPCTQIFDSGLVDGPLQLLFDGSDMMLFDLRTSTVTESHGFATDGVHHYGEFTAIETDGRVVATTLENEAYAFLYYAHDVVNNPPVWGEIVYSSFGGGEKRLLEVVAGQAVLALPGAEGVEIVSRQLEPAPAFETAAEATSMRVILEGGSSEVEDYRVLSHDEARLVVTDGTRLFVVTLGADETVLPMVLSEKGSQPVCL